MVPEIRTTGLTEGQAELLAFIRNMAVVGVTPSYEQMMEAVGLKSKSGIHRMVGALVERGRIRRIPNKARSLELVAEGNPLAAFTDQEIFTEVQKRLGSLQSFGKAT